MANDIQPTAGGLPAAQSEKDEGFNSQFSKMEPQFKAALPPHMPVDRFMRVVLTAVNGNPDLINADRRSLFEASMKAAQDGLLPDGREGALVIYNTKIPGKNGERDRWMPKVQWMPMIAGLLKRIRNSGELSTIVARVVYSGDHYRNWIDDDGEHIEFESKDDHDESIVRKVFAMAKLKDGGIEVEEMTPTEVEKIRQFSKAKDGPAWKNWWAQMAQKSTLRRLSKRLPISSDLDDLIRRDDDLYDFSNKSGELPEGFDVVKHPLRDPPDAPRLTRGAAPMDRIADEPEPETVENETQQQQGSRQADRSTEAGQQPRQDDRITTGPQGPQERTQREPDAGGGNGGAVQNNGRADAGGAPAGNRKPYDMTAESYKTYMRDEFDRAKSPAAVNDLWGATRADRLELLGDEDRDELTADKNATIQRLKLKKGGA